MISVEDLGWNSKILECSLVSSTVACWEIPLWGSFKRNMIYKFKKWGMSIAMFDFGMQFFIEPTDWQKYFRWLNIQEGSMAWYTLQGFVSARFAKLRTISQTMSAYFPALIFHVDS